MTQNPQTSPASDDLFPVLDPLPITKAPSRMTKKSEILLQDAKMYHTILTNLAYSWSQANTVDEVCKLALTTDKVIQGRRRALLLPLGAPNAEEVDDGYILPLE